MTLAEALAVESIAAARASARQGLRRGGKHAVGGVLADQQVRVAEEMERAFQG